MLTNKQTKALENLEFELEQSQYILDRARDHEVSKVWYELLRAMAQDLVRALREESETGI